MFAALTRSIQLPKIEIVGKLLYKNPNEEAYFLKYRAFQGACLLGKSPYNWSEPSISLLDRVTKCNGTIVVTSEGFFVVPREYPNAVRIAATWARHEQDSVIIEVASNVKPVKGIIGDGAHCFREGATIEVLTIYKLSEAWKNRANLKEL